MKKITTRLVLFAFVALALSSCKTKAKAYLYTESSIQPNDVRAKTVAILPNRLPVTLQNLEELRLKNYATMRRILESKGYSVIDYNTSNQLFQQSGLPMEDTKLSRDKYAELAQKLNADLLIFPYYGTTFSMTSFSRSYVSVSSLQFYSLKHNDFSARIDLEGVTKIQTWPTMVPGVGLIWQIFLIGPSKKAHSKSFLKGFQEGLNVYASRFTAGNYQNNNSNSNSNSSSSKYAKYSVEELETLKKAAAGNGDYKTAGDIKDEIEKRKK